MPDLELALNQKTVPELPFDEFLDLAARLGCVGVEPRTDLGRPIFDGIVAADAGRMARDRGLRLIGLSEVYPFDDWNEERRSQVAKLIAFARDADAGSIGLIPRVDGRGPPSPERENRQRAILADIVGMLKGAGVRGLVEPIGFSKCSIRRQADAVALIKSLHQVSLIRTCAPNRAF